MAKSILLPMAESETAAGTTGRKHCFLDLTDRGELPGEPLARGRCSRLLANLPATVRNFEEL
jgi:hypothetical protein